MNPEFLSSDPDQRAQSRWQLREFQDFLPVRLSTVNRTARLTTLVWFIYAAGTFCLQSLQTLDYRRTEATPPPPAADDAQRLTRHPTTIQEVRQRGSSHSYINSDGIDILLTPSSFSRVLSKQSPWVFKGGRADASPNRFIDPCRGDWFPLTWRRNKVVCLE